MHTQRNIMHTQRNIAAMEHAMHPLTTLGEPAQNFAGGVRFMMMDGATRVTCWVNREALDRIQRGNACQLDPMASFQRYRREIEHIANQKYDAGERSPIVLSFYFERWR